MGSRSLNSQTTALSRWVNNIYTLANTGWLENYSHIRARSPGHGVALSNSRNQISRPTDRPAGYFGAANSSICGSGMHVFSVMFRARDIIRIPLQIPTLRQLRPVAKHALQTGKVR